MYTEYLESHWQELDRLRELREKKTNGGVVAPKKSSGFSKVESMKDKPHDTFSGEDGSGSGSEVCAGAVGTTHQRKCLGGKEGRELSSENHTHVQAI